MYLTRALICITAAILIEICQCEVYPCNECVANSQCVNDTCVCNPGFEGIGTFYCNNAGTKYSMHECNDPTLSSLSGENVVYHVIGSTRLVQMATTRNSGGTCLFYLWGWTERRRGKMYHTGLSWRLDQHLSDGTGNTRRGHIRTVGEAGEPYHREMIMFGATSLEPVETFSNHHIGGCDVSLTVTFNEFVHANIPCCDIEFGIRPYHPDFPNRLPGTWFSVKKEANPTYDSWTSGSEPMALDHSRTVTITDIIESTGITLGRRQAMTFHAITNSGMVNYPNAPAGLSLLKSMLRDCPVDRRDQLFSEIYYFFDLPPLTRCLNGVDGTSMDVSIEAIQLAISMICEDVSDSCEMLATLLQTPDCHNLVQSIPMLAWMADPSNCPRGSLHDEMGPS